MQRGQSTVATLVSQVQKDTARTPLASYINAHRGQVSYGELLKHQAASEEGPLNKSSIGGLDHGVLETLMHELHSGLKNNEGLQTFLVIELRYLASQNDAITFKRCLEGLSGDIGSSAGQLASRLSSSRQAVQTSLMMEILVELCLHWNNTLLAATTVMKNTVDESTVRRVLGSLLLKDPKYDDIQLDLIMKIGGKYQYKLNEYEISQLYEKLASIYDMKTVLHRVTLFLMDHAKANNRNSDVRQVYRQIVNDALMHNRAGMCSNWRKIIHYYPDIMDHDPNVLSILIKEFCQAKEYITLAGEIFAEIPEERYTHAFLVEAVMEYASRMNDVELVNSIVEKLEAPVPRAVLSQLLKLNMKLGDYQSLDKIMAQLQLEGMSSVDYGNIVHGLLKRGKLMDSVTFAHGLDPALSNVAYLKIVNYLINTRGQFHEKELVIIQGVVDRCKGVFDMKHSFWTMLSSLFIKYITKSHAHVGVWQSKMIYERSTKDFLSKAYAESRIKSPVLDTAISLNPWSVDLTRRHLIRLQINTRSRPVVVKTIFDRAKKLKMDEVMDWALLELTELGITPADVKMDVTRSYNSRAAQLGFGDMKSDE